MNWMGGARNRVKFQGERKIQKEFFDRKRLTARAALCRGPWIKKSGLSQDLAALHTVSRAHSRTQGNGKQQPIKSVDLEKFQSCTRPVQEVDMGPASPLHTPSKLFLMDANTSASSSLLTKRKKTDAKSADRSANTSSNMTISSAEDSFRKNSAHPIQEIKPGHWKNSTPMFPLPHPDITMTTSFKDGTDKKLPVRDKSVKSKQTLRQTVFNPFVSEDFQSTPLKKYTNQSSQSTDMCNLDTKGHDKSLSRSFRMDHEQRKPSPESPEFAKYFTSTPFKQSKHHKHGYRHSELSFSSTKVSPIQKLPSPVLKKTSGYLECEQDNISYRPRPILRADNDEQRKDPKFNNTSTLAMEKPIKYRFGLSNTGNKLKSQGFATDSTPVFVYDTETAVSDLKIDGNSATLNSKKRLHTKKNTTVTSPDAIKAFRNITYSDAYVDTTIDNFAKYDADVSSFSPDKTLQPKNIPSTRENATETASTLLFFKHRSMMSETPTPESNTRDKLHAHTGNEFNKSVSLDTPVNSNGCEGINFRAVPKPLCVDYDSDFQYKPFKKRKHSLEAVERVMTMYNSYKKPKDDTGLDETPTVRRATQKFSQDRDRRKSGGSVSAVTSPTTADEFPSSLQAKLISTQVHGDLEAKLSVPAPISSTGAVSAQSPEPEEHAAQSPRTVYVPTAKKMDDVLREMSQLEDGDTVEPEHKDEPACPTVPHIGDPSTEATEADRYLESEEMLWNESSKNVSNTHTTAHPSITSSQDDITDAATHAVGDDTAMKSSDLLPVNAKATDMCATEETHSGVDGEAGVGHVSDKPHTELNDKQQLESDDKPANWKSSIDGTFSGHEPNNPCETVSPQRDDTVSHELLTEPGISIVPGGEGSENVELNTTPGSCRKQGKLESSVMQDERKQNTPSVVGNALTIDSECKHSFDVGKHEMEGIESVYFKTPKNLLNTSKFHQKDSTNGEAINPDMVKSCPNAKPFVIPDNTQVQDCQLTGNTIVVQKVQYPEVSSGRSTSVQTDIKQFVDVASSPFVDLLKSHEDHVTRSIGTQCSIMHYHNIEKHSKPNIPVPRLGHLAGTLLKVKPISTKLVRFISQHKGATTKAESRETESTNLVRFCGQRESMTTKAESRVTESTNLVRFCGQRESMTTKTESQETETKPQCSDTDTTGE